MTTNSSVKKSRQPRLKRQDERDRPGLVLTDRDIQIINAIYEYRALTTPQIDELFFPSMAGERVTVSSRCLHRLRLLYHHGFVDRVEQPLTFTQGPKPLIYVLDKKGAQLLTEVLDTDEKALGWQPKDKQVTSLFLSHLIATNDVRIALTLAAARSNYSVAIWRDERTLRRTHMIDTVTITNDKGGKEKAALVPDAYCVLESTEHRYHFFIEIDRATETGASSVWGRRDWSRKIRAYLAYYNSGKYEERYKSTGLRILTVTTGEKRLANLKAVTEQTGGKSRFWFTIFRQATADHILTAPIWAVATRDQLQSLTW